MTTFVGCSTNGFSLEGTCWPALLSVVVLGIAMLGIAMTTNKTNANFEILRMV